MKQQRVKFTDVARVLIESDWNLKHAIMDIDIAAMSSINRIRLEFKVISFRYGVFSFRRINRIRLEFKGYCRN